MSYLLASLVSGAVAIGWWLGGLELFMATGLANVVFCSAIAAVAAGAFVGAFWRPDIAWLGADNCLSLGLLGTIAGLIFALPHVSDTASAVVGISLALWTTGVGLVGYMVLYLHGWLLGLEGE